MARQRKRSRKFLGSRSHGKGNAKNRRGKGNKGGWGRAGMHKHRFSYVTVYERDWMEHGSRFGFVNHNRPARLPSMNLYEIEQMAQRGKIQKRQDMLYFEFSGKILGTGTLSFPVHVKAAAFSKGAKEKIQKAGGVAELMQEGSAAT
ncbi:MAG: uL15 family ribosomal protein [Candidatus Micrarchaeota archaeon]|nr:uL15 family ribosomal protein [Candidatus Micrarchaeota archaeon]